MTNYTHLHSERLRRHNKDEGNSSLEKYTSYFIRKGFVWERWVGDRRKTATYWPSKLFWLSQPFFPVLPGCSTGDLAPSLCWDMVLIPASSLQQIWTSCRRGYIIIRRPPTSCERHICIQFNPSTVKGIPSTGCTCYLHRCISYFDSSGRGLYATLLAGMLWLSC